MSKLIYQIKFNGNDETQVVDVNKKQYFQVLEDRNVVKEIINHIDFDYQTITLNVIEEIKIHNQIEQLSRESFLKFDQITFCEKEYVYGQNIIKEDVLEM